MPKLMRYGQPSQTHSPGRFVIQCPAISIPHIGNSAILVPHSGNRIAVGPPAVPLGVRRCQRMVFVPSFPPTSMRTGIGFATVDTITIRDRNLCTDLMGRITFADMAYLLIRGEL